MRSTLPGRMFRRLLVILAAALALANGTRAQNFAQPTVVPTGNWPAAVYTADINADGIPDLIYIDPGATALSSTTHVMLGDGKGSFSQSAVIATAGASVAIGDLTGDGIVDIGWLTWNGAAGSNTFLNIAAGIGTGTFQAIQTISFGFELAGPGSPQPTFTSLLAAPIRGQGYPMDLLAVSNNNTWYDLEPPGPSGYTPGHDPLKFSFLPNGAASLAAADLSNSGQDDLVILTGNNASVTVLMHTALKSGTPFPLGTTFTPAAGVRSFVLNDVNGDGKPDLIAEGANGQINVYLGNGDGTFQTTSWGGSGALDGRVGNGGTLIAAADLNHDGQADLLAATPIGISSLLNQTGGVFALHGIYDAGPSRSSYAVADFNGDGNLDIALPAPEGIAILYGNADGSFQTSQAFAAGQPAMSGAVGVFNSAGHIDAVVSTAATQAQLLHGNGDGTFLYAGAGLGQPTPTTAQTGTAGLWSVIQAGDFNGDGKSDIVLTADGPVALIPRGAGPGGTNIEFGNGDGTFSSLNPIPYVHASRCPAATNQINFYGTSVVAPFFGGGQLNLAARDSSLFQVFADSPTLPVYNWDLLYANCDNLYAHDLLAAGDFNNDGLPDLAVQYDGHLHIILKSGPSFPFELLGSNVGASVDPGDLSVDGSLTTLGQATAPVLNSSFNGPAIPASSGGLGFPAFTGAMAIADLDGDGYGDLIVAYANLSANLQAPTLAAPNYVYIWFGSGNGRFLTSAKHPVNPVVLSPSRNYYQAAIADLNGDGIPDLILSDGYILSVQLGKGDGTFLSESHYLAGQGINSISVADVNGDGKPDLILANGGAVLTNPVANLETLATNPDVNTGGITVLLNRASAALPVPTANLAASPEPSTYSNAFTITATLNAVSPSPAPTGTVTFTFGTTLIGSANIVGGAATIAVPASLYSTLAPGTYPMTASYSGDSNYSPIASISGSHTVALIPTTMSLLLCVDPPGSNFPCGNPIGDTPLISPITMYYGQSLDGVAIESASNLTGTITFLSGSRVFCTLNANLQFGSNTCPPNSGIFPAGTTTVIAVYSGDSVHLPSTSNAIVVTVYPDPTTATVASSQNPATVGTPVTFTANVQGNYAIPEGEPIFFFDGTTLMTTGTLDATGSATFTTSALAIGTHPITVVLPGSANFNSTTSPVLTQIIEPLTTSVASAVSLVSNRNPSAPAQPVTFTATVTVPGPFPIVPTGSVTFLDGTSALANVALNSGIATFTTSSLTSGSHAMTASYSGAAGTVGVGPVKPPAPPKPPNPLFHPGVEVPSGFRVSGPVLHAEVPRNPFLLPFSPPAIPETVSPQPLAVATPPILASVSPVLTQVVTTAIGEEPEGFVLTVSPVPVTLGVGRTSILLVTIRDVSGFNQAVQLGCTGLPVEATCTFVQPLIPVGGGSTSLYLATSAPRDCGTNDPYFLGSLTSGPGRTLAFAMPGLVLILTGVRRRWRKRANLLGGAILLLTLAALSALSGCGHCTDLGTRPGSYSFTLTATPQGGPSTQVQSQKIALTVTIP